MTTSGVRAEHRRRDLVVDLLGFLLAAGVVVLTYFDSVEQCTSRECRSRST